jgi:branched-chain amino acid transport system substrate-binding protein
MRGSCLLALLVCACRPEPEPETVCVGSIKPLTGDQATQNLLRAYDLAVQAINEAGGVLDLPLEVVHVDDHSDEARGAEAARELVEQGVGAMLASAWSGGTLAVAEVTVPARVVQVSAEATSPELTTFADDGFLFRTIPSDALQGRLLAQRALAMGHQRAAVLHEPGAYGMGIAEVFAVEFAALGGEVLSVTPYPEAQLGYRELLEDTLSQEPDVILLGAYLVDAGTIIRDYNTYLADRPVAWLFPDALLSRDFVDVVGPDGFSFEHEGTAPSGVGPAVDVFFALSPESEYALYETNGFDAVFLVALAIEQAGTWSDGEAIRDALAAVSSEGERFGPESYADAVAAIRRGEDIDFYGTSGEVDLDEHGDVVAPYSLWSVRNGDIDIHTDDVVPE